MARLSNARTIIDIEAIVSVVDRPGKDRHHWQIKGIDCVRETHRYSGAAYAFSVDVLQLKLTRAGRTVWHAMLVTELWRGAGETDTDMRATRWLKLVRGKKSDVTEWIRTNRDHIASHGASASGVEDIVND